MSAQYGITGSLGRSQAHRRPHAPDCNRVHRLRTPVHQPAMAASLSCTTPRSTSRWIRGRHALKAGYEYQRIHTEIQDVNPLYGNDFYQGNFSGQPLADFMFGLRSEYQLVNFYVAQYRQVMNYAYLQDDWKVSPKLTLNLGVRYEYATPQWERDNRLSNFDPVTNSLIPPRTRAPSPTAHR